MKLTRHNGRFGKNGIFNPKHNDRSFNVANSDHIDEARTNHNVYWNCIQGIYTQQSQCNEDLTNSADAERAFYRINYSAAANAQNDRNAKSRHTERNKKPEDLLGNRTTCPEETIFQIGTMAESVDPDVLVHIAYEFFLEFNKRFGEHVHILDWSLHLDESTSHIHERHVFDAPDKYGFVFPQQDKALELLGIERPNPDAPKSKNNNRKMTFDKICRELLYDICEKNRIYLDRNPEYGGRHHLEKQEFIIEEQKRKIAELEAELQEKVLRISDVETIIDDVSELAYQKACEVVAETAQTEVTAVILKELNQELQTSAKKNPPKIHTAIASSLNSIITKIKFRTRDLFQRIRKRLASPAVAEANKQEIREAGKESLKEMLQRFRQQQKEHESDRRHERKKELNTER